MFCSNFLKLFTTCISQALVRYQQNTGNLFRQFRDGELTPKHLLKRSYCCSKVMIFGGRSPHRPSRSHSVAGNAVTCTPCIVPGLTKQIHRLVMEAHYQYGFRLYNPEIGLQLYRQTTKIMPQTASMFSFCRRHDRVLLDELFLWSSEKLWDCASKNISDWCKLILPGHWSEECRGECSGSAMSVKI